MGAKPTRRRRSSHYPVHRRRGPTAMMRRLGDAAAAEVLRTTSASFGRGCGSRAPLKSRPWATASWPPSPPPHGPWSAPWPCNGAFAGHNDGGRAR